MMKKTTNPGGESLLLDTHVWYRFALGDKTQGSARAWSVVTESAQRGAAAVSEITFWELAVKAHNRHLQLDPEPRVWLQVARQRAGVGIIQVDRRVLVESALLAMKHRDPADRILVATAQRYHMRLATADDAILDYAQTGKLKVLDMRNGPAMRS